MSKNKLSRSLIFKDFRKTLISEFGEATAELANTDDFVRMKHGRDYEKFVKEVLSSGQVVYTYNNGTVCYIYEFAEL